MSFADLGAGGSLADKTAATSIVLTPSVNYSAGELIIVSVAKDNAATADGNTNEVTSVTDSVGGNTWAKLREFCNAQGAGDAGATVSVWYSILTNGITTADTITANFSDSRTAKTIIARRFSLTAGYDIALEGTQDFAKDGTGLATNDITLSGLTNREYLLFLAIADELTTINGSWTGYTQVNVATAGAAQASNILGSINFKIVTTTGETPSTSGTSIADYACMFLAIYEVPPPGIVWPIQAITQQAVHRASRW